MNILIISDIHNDVENMLIYIDKLTFLDFDVIVATGDFVDQNIPRGFKEIDMGKLILEELLSLKKPILTVPGNQDKNLIQFFEKKNIGLHRKGKIMNNVGFYGFGGAITPFGTPLEPSESEIETGLRNAYEMVKRCEIKVQATHIPPARTKVDVIPSGAHVGSENVRKFIEERQPNAAICAHVHEARGVDELGKTKIINSGRFPEGYCGLITVKKGKTTAKIINLI